MPPSGITILGGGITGLASAFHLSRRFPSARIVLLEKSQHLGGWIQTKRVQFRLPGADEGNAVLELGPRTLRPQSTALLELVNLLGLNEEIIATPRAAPAARNRFLFLPDRNKPGLTAIPQSLLAYLRSPLTGITVPAVVREFFRRNNRPDGLEDESFDSFMTRRFGPEFARVLGSALVHGIYAADSRKLSMRSSFSPLWDAEERGGGSILRGFMRSRRRPPSEDAVSTSSYELGSLEDAMRPMSVYSFKAGMTALPDALHAFLRKTSNVEVRTGVDVKHVGPNLDGFEVQTSHGKLSSSHLVSAVPLSTLHKIISPANPLPHLTANPSSSVTVASFVLPGSSAKQHPQGFGYLIPRPIESYGSTANSLGILGVVFDSCSLGAQDLPRGHFTKLTMMLGGPYEIADDRPEVLFDALQQHIGRTLREPVYVQVTRHLDCIPTYLVGHLSRMEELRAALKQSPWHGRAEVAGAGVGGVSVGDCVEQGRRVGLQW